MDFEARKVIEALRSGIPSRTIGNYFSSARSELLADISQWLSESEGGGRILTASYGEGKTHLHNTIFSMAHRKNMVVSMVSISRETPFNNAPLMYQKIAKNTFLPNREQPGFDELIDKLSPASLSELQLYAAKELQTDKLYFLLKSFIGTDDNEIRQLLLSDIYGYFITLGKLKKIYKEIFNEKAVFSASFKKTVHIRDYHMFLSKLFSLSGYNGWVVLFDEAEHIGRLGRKSRFVAYSHMSKFLNPDSSKAKSLFTITNNYATQVIDDKNEREHLASTEGVDREAIEDVLYKIETAEELTPLNKDEFTDVLHRIVKFHAQAFSWTPTANLDELCEMAWSRGHYLRTKIRAVIEYLDQLYQYGDVKSISADDLEEETYTEQIPMPEEI